MIASLRGRLPPLAHPWTEPTRAAKAQMALANWQDDGTLLVRRHVEFCAKHMTPPVAAATSNDVAVSTATPGAGDYWKCVWIYQSRWRSLGHICA